MIAEGPVAQSEPSHSDNNEAIQGTQVAHPNSEWSGKIGNEWNAQKDWLIDRDKLNLKRALNDLHQPNKNNNWAHRFTLTSNMPTPGTQKHPTTDFLSTTIEVKFYPQIKTFSIAK